MNKLLVLKGVVIVLQLVLIVLLVSTGIPLKDIKNSQKFIESVIKLGGNGKPLTAAYELLLSKVNTRYGVLVTVVILSTLKVPVISAGIILNHCSCHCSSIHGSLEFTNASRTTTRV